MVNGSSKKLTMPDLLLLSLLAERPLHGYEVISLLELRNVRDWAGVSRTQVYYSLEKLGQSGLIKQFPSDIPVRNGRDPEKPGPDRRILGTTDEGRTALADALERQDWTEQLDRQPFLAWLALSWQCRTGVVMLQIERRRQFLEKEFARKKRLLDDVITEVGHLHHEAVWMLELAISQIETELSWLQQLARELPLRAGAKGSAKPQP